MTCLETEVVTDMVVDGVDLETLVVHRPWAWCWWTAAHPLVDADPDAESGRESRIRSAEVDWKRLLAAVRYAVSRCDLLDDPFAYDVLTVELLEPLTKVEHIIASRWVGDGSSVVYGYDAEHLWDGRHRLWLARSAVVAQGDVPIRAECLEYLRAAQGDQDQLKAFLRGLSEAVLWWTQAADDLRDRNRVHRENLGRAYLLATEPSPVSEWWLQYLHNWDNLLEVLASLHAAGRADEVLGHLPRAWRMDPGQVAVPVEARRSLVRGFHAMYGFTVAGTSLPAPRGHLTLYRGAVPEAKAGLSWSVDPDIAREFARYRQPLGSQGQLWKVRVPASRCLMFLPDEGEFVVDLSDLEDSVVEAPRPTVTADVWTRFQVRILRWRAALVERIEEREW